MTEKTNLCIRLTPEVHKALKLHAVKNSTSIQDVINNAVKKIIKDTK